METSNCRLLMCFLIHGNSAVVLLLSLLMKCFVVSLCVLRGALRSLILIGLVSGACLERRRCEMPDRLNSSGWPLSAHCSNYNKHSSGPLCFAFRMCVFVCPASAPQWRVQNVVLRALLSSVLTRRP